MTTFIVYQSDDETFITTLEQEHKFLAEWFAPGVGRSVEDFDRTETMETAVYVTPELRVK